MATLDRALSILGAFSMTRPSPSLAEIAAHTRISKSTLLRMLASLQHAGLVLKQADGHYVLGAAVERLQRVRAVSVSVETVVMPVLRELAAATGESASYYVRQGDQRLCLLRVDSPRPVRDHLQVGALLPLNRGAAGRVLLAFSGAQGAVYAGIRRDGVAVLAGDRLAGGHRGRHGCGDPAGAGCGDAQRRELAASGRDSVRAYSWNQRSSPWNSGGNRKHWTTCPSGIGTAAGAGDNHF